MTTVYPSRASDRTRWIVERRGSTNGVDASRAHAYFVEQERSESGCAVEVATIFLTNRECPWKCVMCDLWRNTTEQSVRLGEIPAQINSALAQLPRASILKLYNSGSFFDPRAIPRSDWADIAQLCARFNRLIVECHPALVGPAIMPFVAMLPCALEIALGLETAHPKALEAINKRITTEDFRVAADFLRANEIALRTFLLINPPFIDASAQLVWLSRSIEFAFDCSSDVVSLIPLRSGNGATDELIANGLAAEPTLREIEHAQEVGLELSRGRLFVDTWDLQRFTSCSACLGPRAERIARMNLSQRVEPRVSCADCEAF